jgi:hypothetical protein
VKRWRGPDAVPVQSYRTDLRIPGSADKPGCQRPRVGTDRGGRAVVHRFTVLRDWYSSACIRYVTSSFSYGLACGPQSIIGVALGNFESLTPAHAQIPVDNLAAAINTRQNPQLEKSQLTREFSQNATSEARSVHGAKIFSEPRVARHCKTGPEAGSPPRQAVVRRETGGGLRDQASRALADGEPRMRPGATVVSRPLAYHCNGPATPQQPGIRPDQGRSTVDRRDVLPGAADTCVSLDVDHPVGPKILISTRC